MENNAADCRLPDEAEEDDDLRRRPDEAEAEDDLGRRPDEAEEEADDDDSVLPVSGLCCSKHSDGSIYSGRHFFQRFFHLADTRETLLDAMMLCNPTNCRPCISMCKLHRATAIFSLKLVKTGVAADDRPIRLYGFLAVRDSLNPLRNYIFNRTREDPLVLGQHQQGSSHPGSFTLPMAGPKRGIQMRTCVLIEYDLKAKRGEKEDDDDSDDLQLVDGADIFSEVTSVERRVYTRRIRGDCGALEISYALLRSAVEATVQVWVEQRHGSSLHLSLSCSVS